MDLAQTSFFCFLSVLRKELREKIYRSQITHYTYIEAVFIVSDIFKNVYLWLAIGPSWLIHNSAGFVATPIESAKKENS